jgi:hypothetical protein
VTQDADGILGLSKTENSRTRENGFQPIYKAMYEAGLIEEMMFALCLGSNGGYFQLGGYDKQGFLDPDVTWLAITGREDFKVKVVGVKMNNHFLAGSNLYNIGFFDSGTTFTYFPTALFT